MKKETYMYIYIAIIFSLSIVGAIIGNGLGKKLNEPRNQLMYTLLGGGAGLFVGSIVMIIIKKTKEDKDPEAKAK